MSAHMPIALLKIKPKQRCFDLILSILEVHHKSSRGLGLAFWMVKQIKNSLKYLSFRTKLKSTTNKLNIFMKTIWKKYIQMYICIWKCTPESVEL